MVASQVTAEPTTETVAVPIPAPPSPPGFGLEVEILVSGSVSDYSDEDIAAFTASMDEAAGVTGGTTTVSPASVLFT